MLFYMDISSVGTALDLLGKASKGLDSVRERAKTSNDAAFKENISKLYDDFLDLKAVILRLTEENAELRRQIADTAEKPPKPELRQVGNANYYFVGDEGPFCQPCFDSNQKLINLTPRKEFGSHMGRQCLVCHHVFSESENSTPPRRIQITPYGD